MLFSASDDGTVRLWDLAQRVCVRVFSGHVGQVQSLKLLMVDRSRVEEVDEEEPESHSPSLPSPQGFDPTAHRSNPNTPPAVGLSSGSASSSRKEQSVLAFYSSSHPTPVLLSGSLDNTIKVWDVETGKPLKTLFGHIEGVWAVDGDRLRVISGSHDRTIKIWERETGRCQTTLVGHRGAVTCLSLADDKIVSGGDDGDLRIWDFGLKAGY